MTMNIEVTHYEVHCTGEIAHNNEIGVMVPCPWHNARDVFPGLPEMDFETNAQIDFDAYHVNIPNNIDISGHAMGPISTETVTREI